MVEARLDKPAAVPSAPTNAAEPVVVRAANRITPTKLPLRIGADSQGGSRFRGDLARVLVVDHALGAAEVAALAEKGNTNWAAVPGAAVALAGEQIKAGRLPVSLVARVEVLPAEGGLTGRMIRLDGSGYVEIPHDALLNGGNGITLAAWVRPAALEAQGMRLIDKSPVGTAAGYLLDTYPGNSLRLISREPHLVFDAKLPLHTWTHVAATVDGQTGRQVLYVNGQVVAERE